jgi:hypothetical protein
MALDNLKVVLKNSLHSIDAETIFKEISKHSKKEVSSSGVVSFNIPINDYLFEQTCLMLDEHINIVDLIEHSRMGFVYKSEFNKKIQCDFCSTTLTIGNDIEIKQNRFNLQCTKCKQTIPIKKISEWVYLILKR